MVCIAQQLIQLDQSWGRKGVHPTIVFGFCLKLSWRKNSSIPMEDEMIFPLPYDGYMMLFVLFSDKHILLILAVETGRDHPTFQPRWKHLCLWRCFFPLPHGFHHEKPICFLDHLVISQIKIHQNPILPIYQYEIPWFIIIVQNCQWSYE
jgi:hypothetical protein